jgi:hypothetical protein
VTIRRRLLAPRLLLCAIAKDETQYLQEWADHHLGLGFSRIVIYDNESRIPIRAKALHPRKVTVRPWKTKTGRPPQLSAYTHCLWRDGWRYDWLMYLDLDEFMNLKRHDTMADFIKDYEAFDAVAINWRIFGSAGAHDNTGAPVKARFIRAAPPEFDGNSLVKTIFRPRAAKGAGVHGPYLWRGARLVNVEGARLDPALGYHNRPCNFEIAQINHYFNKSYAEFQVKRRRGRADLPETSADKFRDEATFAQYDRNEEEDASILRHAARTPQSTE